MQAIHIMINSSSSSSNTDFAYKHGLDCSRNNYECLGKILHQMPFLKQPQLVELGTQF